MPNCCISYIADNAYLLPTFVSATQARRMSSLDLADVFVFCINLTKETESSFAHACLQENIHLRAVSSSQVENASAMMARLFLARFVPQQYTQFLYLDGDVHIHSSLDPLIRATPAPGHFLASIDVMTFVMRGGSRFGAKLRNYFLTLGFTPAQISDYFNSGVLRMPREGWDEIGDSAWKYYLDNQSTSRFPDQDALNMVAGDRQLPMSLAWNYPIFLQNARLDQQFKPAVVHFVSSPKPWFGSFQPWKSSAHEVYLQAVDQYPALRPYLLQMKRPRRVMYIAQQWGKRLLETLSWGFSQRRTQILEYERKLSRSPNLKYLATDS